MINTISLKNFKCFQQTDINLSRITLLTGENSSGKSSVLYGLLAPFQSNEFPLYLSPNGRYVNMGDFKEISFNNLKENKIEIDISVTDWEEKRYQTVWGIDSMNRMPKLNHLRYEEDFLDLDLKMSGENTYTLNFNADNEKALELYTDRLRRERVDDRTSEALRISFPKYENVKNLNFESDKFYEEIQDRFPCVFTGMNDDNLNFIGPFRFEPERTYYQKTKADEKIGRAGEGYIDQISEWENQKAGEFEELESVLINLGLLNAIKTRPLRGGRFELSVKIRLRGVWASLADVGFGISQFLPVVVADLQLSDNSILLLAQPEIHLHPSVQASLADYFVRQTRETGKQYLVETHSEYLLNRIRLAIVKQEIDPSEVSVYYFENSAAGSVTYPIEFTRDGQIKNAPQGFFDTYMLDTMDIALYA